MVNIAIDGRCASGKTTVASLLSKIYDCNVFHIDDFFLRPEQRTSERLSQPGENADHERFESEILIPLKEGKDVIFRRFDCSVQALEAPITVKKKRLNIIEGSYSLHPSLRKYYTLKCFIDIDSSLQAERIEARNTPDAASRFFSTWIPLEEKYLSALDVRDCAEVIL